MNTELLQSFIEMVSETNGITLMDTLNLMLSSSLKSKHPQNYNLVLDFKNQLDQFSINKIPIQNVLIHPFADVIYQFFKIFPLKFNEEHIHLTGSLTPEFIWSKLKIKLDGPHRQIILDKIKQNYGNNAIPIKDHNDIKKLICLDPNDGFTEYLKVLFLAKLIFTDKETHREASFHLASEQYHKYNVGKIRLKFSLSRSTADINEQIPGSENLTSKDVILGLYEGFRDFKKTHPDFDFILSPSFRKEENNFDSSNFSSRKEHFEKLISEIIELLDQHPELKPHLCDVDTVGDEREMYSKSHFNEFKIGFRKLQSRGIKIRSHHGETWHTLRKGIQAVDNAMNIWHIDTLEHGISLGINPNIYFHQIYQNIIKKNIENTPISTAEKMEMLEIDWSNHKEIPHKIINNTALNENERKIFLKNKFYYTKEIEQYQHDVLNRLINKNVSLVALPSSNNRLTGKFKDYKEHPFSWWEKKNVNLGIGTDNYVTLNTNFIQEMIILLLTDPCNLKITKLIMVATNESRRPYISDLLWRMRKINC